MSLADPLSGIAFIPLGFLSISSGWAVAAALAYLLLILAGQGVSVVLALKMPSLKPGEVGRVPRPVRLSVIIPTRNEESDLGHLLDDLQRQDFLTQGGGALEVLVVDGGSTDGTLRVARAHPLRVRVIEEPPLPSGWVGKNWACHTGQLAASGEHLLFLDADVRLSPEALRAAVVEQIAHSADMVTFAARVVMVGFWEHVVLPLYTQFVLTYFKPHRVNRPDSPNAMANGQFLLMPRLSYDRTGGHQAIRGYVLEDVRLAQKVKQSGGRIRVLWTPEMVSTRMYTDRTEMFEGLSKNIHGTEFVLTRQVGFIAAISMLFLSPFVVLGLAILYSSLLWLVVSALAIFLTVLKQAAFQNAIHAPLGYALSYPLGCGFYLALLGHSIRGGVSGGSVSWKGRRYRFEPENP